MCRATILCVTHFPILASNLFPLGTTCSCCKLLKHFSPAFVKCLCFHSWECGGKPHDRSCRNSPNPLPSTSSAAQGCLYTHIDRQTHIKSSSTSEILQKQKIKKISSSELCPSPPTNGFQAGLWIFLFKSCSLRRGGDGQGKGHWEKAEGRSC